MNAAPPPEHLQRDYPLARLTTIRTGGNADWFARPRKEQELEGLLAWAQEEGLDVGVVGSGSNLLVADLGFAGLVLKLDGSLAAIEHEATRLLCGGGARLPQAAARAAALGLGGIEFGVSIPGTVGGAVRMNANAYGGELSRALEWVDVCTAAGIDRRRPEQLGFAYRRSNLGPGEIVARVSFSLETQDPQTVKATLADLRGRRREAQPSGIKTFGSTFKNPDPDRTAGRLLEEAGCKGLQVGDARFSPKHANFIENLGTATTAEVVSLIAEGRRRVSEHSGVLLEPEVQLLGDVEFPWEER